MKFLIPSPFFDDSFASNVAAGLKQAGHEVIAMPPTSIKLTQLARIGNIYNRLREKMSREYISSTDRWVLRAAREHHPDVVLMMTRTLADGTLRELKRLGVTWRVVWWGDPPGNMRQMGLFSREWDVIFFKDRDAVFKFRRLGLNAHWLQQAMNPLWHKPVAQQKNNTVVVAGNFYGFRQFLVRELIDEGVDLTLYGGPLPLWSYPEIAALHSGRYIVKEDKSRVFGEAMACLNSTHVMEGDSLNARMFEIAGAAGLQLTEFKPILAEYFEPGKELLTFDSMEELTDHIERARQSPEEMVPIRIAGHRRVLAEHTYYHRVKEMEKHLR